jgi:hypothetical protein
LEGAEAEGIPFAQKKALVRDVVLLDPAEHSRFLGRMRRVGADMRLEGAALHEDVVRHQQHYRRGRGFDATVLRIAGASVLVVDVGQAEFNPGLPLGDHLARMVG